MGDMQQMDGSYAADVDGRYAADVWEGCGHGKEVRAGRGAAKGPNLENCDGSWHGQRSSLGHPSIGKERSSVWWWLIVEAGAAVRFEIRFGSD